jgi:hypothetical protein
MISKKILFLIIIHCNIIHGMAQLVQLGVQLVAVSAQQAAAVKMQTEGYKQELINTQKAITDLVEREKTKTNNLIKISNIKNELVKNIEINKNESQLIIDALYKIIYTSYKNFINLSKKFKEKYNKFLVQQTSSSNILFKVGLTAIQEVLYQYIFFLKEYNYQLQNVSQKIEFNGQFNSVYVEMPENEKFIDPAISNNELIKNLDSFLSNTDEKGDTLLRSRDLLSNNNVILFNTISNKILDTINNLENNESNKDIDNMNQVFYDLGDQLSIFKDKLFIALNEFSLSQSEAKSILYKTIALLDINYNKIKNIILYIDNSIESKNYTINDFVKELYKNVLNNKKVIKNSKEIYLNSLSKNNNGLKDLVKLFNDFLVFMKTNIEKINFSMLNEFLNRAKSVIASYQNSILIKNKEIESGVLFLSYLDNFLIELKDNATKFQSNLKDKSTTKDDIKFNIHPDSNIFDQIYSKNKNHKKKHESNSLKPPKLDSNKYDVSLSKNNHTDKSGKAHQKKSSKNKLGNHHNKKGVK